MRRSAGHGRLPKAVHGKPAAGGAPSPHIAAPARRTAAAGRAPGQGGRSAEIGRRASSGSRSRGASGTQQRLPPQRLRAQQGGPECSKGKAVEQRAWSCRASAPAASTANVRHVSPASSAHSLLGTGPVHHRRSVAQRRSAPPTCRAHTGPVRSGGWAGTAHCLRRSGIAEQSIRGRRGSEGGGMPRTSSAATRAASAASVSSRSRAQPARCTRSLAVCPRRMATTCGTAAPCDETRGPNA